MPPSVPHPAFRRRVDPAAARRQMKVSLVVVGLLSLAVGLCTSAVAPRSGWMTTVPSIFSSSSVGRLPAG